MCIILDFISNALLYILQEVLVVGASSKPSLPNEYLNITRYVVSSAVKMFSSQVQSEGHVKLVKTCLGLGLGPFLTTTQGMVFT